MPLPFNHAASLPLAAYHLEPPVELFALGEASLNNEVVGVHTDAGDFVAKTYTSSTDLDSIHYEHRLLIWLANTGLSFAVPVPLPARDATLLQQGPHGWMALTHLLPGVCPEFRQPAMQQHPTTLAHAKLLGKAVGELQAVLQPYPRLPRPGRNLFSDLFHFPPVDRNPFTLTPAQAGFPDALAETLAWWRAEATQLQAFVDGSYALLPQQVCHNDVSPANVLVDAGRLSAVLDFEFATVAPRALDVAMGLRMTTQVWHNPEPWDLARHFCRGYRQFIRMTEAEVLALPHLMRLRTAIPFLWWLGRTRTSGDITRLPKALDNLQNLVHWLDRHEQQLVDVVMQEVA
ncbi:MAG: phosphotransferase [Herpetosiphonaceae bacterium]|nr:phosphotransferase [Herpetosiphonaceae bacterium]